MAIDFDKLDNEQRSYAALIGDEAVAAGIPPDLAIAQAYQESGLRHFTQNKENQWNVKRSNQNAYGLMQITPDTAKLYDIDDETLMDPIGNVRGGIKIMKTLMDKYQAPDLAVMAYHQGESPVDKYLSTGDISHLGPKGKQYLLSIGKYYDFSQGDTQDQEKTEAEKIAAEGSNIYAQDANTQKQNVPPTGVENAINFVQEHPGIALPAVGVGTAYMQDRLNKQNVRLSPSILDKEIRLNPSLEDEFTLKNKIPKIGGEELSGDKWSRKVTGSMGPGGDSVTEAARNYRIQQNLPQNQSSIFTTNRSGIIIPNKVQQSIEQEALEAAQKETLNKQNAFARAKESLRKIPSGLSPRSVGMYTKNFPIGNILGGVGAGINVNLAKERMEEDDPLGAAIAGINALSNTAAMIPVNPATTNPYGLGAKGLGVIGSVLGLPLELAYEKWRQSHPLPSIVKEQLKKQKQ